MVIEFQIWIDEERPGEVKDRPISQVIDCFQAQRFVTIWATDQLRPLRVHPHLMDVVFRGAPRNTICLSQEGED